MNIKQMLAVAILFVTFSASDAFADILLVVTVDNQTSSSVSLVQSSTTGTFISGPPSSIAANSLSGAGTETSGISEIGLLEYGSCSIIWDAIILAGELDVDFSSVGTGCDASLSYQNLSGDFATVSLRLDIS